jgi:hypothetical protein
MTDQERRDVADLLDYLDNNMDGAEDAGAFARAATRWHPALKSLSAQVEALTANLDVDARVMATLRAHAGEQDVRIAGLEVERDMARLGAANLIEQQNILRADLARERTAREQAEIERDAWEATANHHYQEVRDLKRKYE